MADTIEPGLPRVVAIAWGMAVAPSRGPRRELSHEKIVAAAIEIADAHGLAAVTMQRLAQSLGFTTMALYRYVASKEELLDLMRDAAVTVPGTESLPTGWRDALRAWAHLMRDSYRRHPWALVIPRRTEVLLMPGAVALVDLGLQAMAELSLEEEQKISTVLTISTYTAAMSGLEQELAVVPDAHYGPEAFAALGEVITEERFPALTPMLMAGEYVGGPPQPQEGLDAEFEFGLDRILDGLERLDRERRAHG